MLKRTIETALVVLGVCHCAIAGATSSFLPQDLMMPDSRVSIVAENSRINGVPTTLFKFIVNRPNAEVREYYKGLFGEKFVENKGQRNTVLGALRDTQYVTVRIDLSAGGQTEGIVSLADFSKPVEHPGLPEGVAEPAEAKLIFSNESNDLGVSSKMYVYQSKSSVGNAATSLKDALAKSGYRFLKEQDAGKGLGGKVLTFSNKKVDLVATVTAGRGGAAVVMNFVSAGGGK